MESDFFRTDLAAEASELFRGETLPGLTVQEESVNGVQVTEVCIDSEEAASRVGKPCGHYLTFDIGKVWKDEPEDFREKACLFGQRLKTLLPPEDHNCVLVVGLGNRHITADAVGPETVEHVFVTRHMKGKCPDLFQSMELSPVAAISPGVLGETGLESADIVRSIVGELKPRAVIVVDALASRRLSRLVTTVQASNVGLAPGSGVGNRRDDLTKESLGVPVLSIGVPTVVDAATLAHDAVEIFGNTMPSYQEIQSALNWNGLNFFVTPKETDVIMKQLSTLIAYGINLALQPNLEYDEMISLVS